MENMNDQKVILTRELVEQCRSPVGGFTRATVQALGIKWPLKSGWIDHLVGVEIYRSSFEKAKDGATKKRQVSVPRWMVRREIRRMVKAGKLKAGEIPPID